MLSDLQAIIVGLIRDVSIHSISHVEAELNHQPPPPCILHTNIHDIHLIRMRMTRIPIKLNIAVRVPHLIHLSRRRARRQSHLTFDLALLHSLLRRTSGRVMVKYRFGKKNEFKDDNSNLVINSLFTEVR